MPMTDPTCAAGHPLGSEPGCLECVADNIVGMDHPTPDEVAAVLRTAIEPLQARVRALEAKQVQFGELALADEQSINNLERLLTAKDAELARVREWAEHFSQLAYDAEGSPLDGWEEVCEAWDEDRLDYLNPEPTTEPPE